MIAVINTGGKQYLVKEGDIISVEKLDMEVGTSLVLPTLLLAEEDGSKVEIGKPGLKTQTTVEVVEQGRAKKVSVVKYKAKSKYKRRVGHRQSFTKIKIISLA